MKHWTARVHTMKMRSQDQLRGSGVHGVPFPMRFHPAHQRVNRLCFSVYQQCLRD